MNPDKKIEVLLPQELIRKCSDSRRQTGKAEGRSPAKAMIR